MKIQFSNKPQKNSTDALALGMRYCKVGGLGKKRTHPTRLYPTVFGQTDVDNLPEFYEINVGGTQVQVKATRRNCEYMSCIATRKPEQKWKQILSVKDARRTALSCYGQSLGLGKLFAPGLHVSQACFCLVRRPSS